MWQLQTPEEKLDWHQDWTDWMEQGDSIMYSDWSISPEGPTISGEDIAGVLTTAFVDGLELGVSYELRNEITTTEGRTGARNITLRCQRS